MSASGSAQLATDDVSIDEWPTGIHLSIETLTSEMVEAIIKEVQKRQTKPIVIHLLPSILDKVRQLDLNSEYDLFTCLQNCEMPVIAVCEDNVLVERERFWLLAGADLVIMSESASILMSVMHDNLPRVAWEARAPSAPRRFLAQSKATERTMTADDALANALADVVAPVGGTRRELDLVLSRFAKVGLHLVKTCKAHLPTTSVDHAALAMAKLAVQDKPLSQASGDLVNLWVSKSGVATVELNDPVYFNDMSAGLMADLALRLQEIQKLSASGEVKAMVLQGAGPHFCTGGWQRPTDEAESSRTPSWSEQMVGSSLGNEIAAMIRNLPIPTLAAVHGKLIGGQNHGSTGWRPLHT